MCVHRWSQGVHSAHIVLLTEKFGALRSQSQGQRWTSPPECAQCGTSPAGSGDLRLWDLPKGVMDGTIERAAATAYDWIEQPAQAANAAGAQLPSESGYVVRAQPL
jgi:hypothetical protein